MKLDPSRWKPPVAIAHRGSRALWPENTMVAFEGAVDLGYRHLETDLHATSDGVLVCFHDRTLERTTDGLGHVAESTLADLHSLDAGHRHATAEGFTFRGGDVRVPTLEEVLTRFPDVSLVVDLKADGLAKPLFELISSLGAQERLIVGSFSDTRLAEFREISGGTVATSTGPAHTRLWVLASRVGRGAGGDAAALQVPVQMRGVTVVDQKLVDSAHNAGMQVHVWTVNHRSEMERLLDLGVDGLITDRPDLLKDVMTERGQWH